MATTKSGKTAGAHFPGAEAHIAPVTISPRHLSAKSLHKAKIRFRHFSLSRFASSTHPKNYVAPKKLKDSTAVRTLNRTTMKENLTKWPVQSPPNVGLTLALSDADLEVLIPSYKPKTGSMNLDELLAALKPKMTSTDFYTNKGPPLVQSSEQERLRKAAQEMIQAIKNKPAAAQNAKKGSNNKAQKATVDTVARTPK